MDKNKVDQFVLINNKYFPQESLFEIRNALAESEESKGDFIIQQQWKNPVLALIISFFVGGFGIDCFYIGDILLGILKLITIGGFGLWWLIDLFLIMSATRSNNLKKFRSIKYML